MLTKKQKAEKGLPELNPPFLGSLASGHVGLASIPPSPLI